MKNVDYIIVGAGYAGVFFAHQLIKHRKSFVIYSDNENSASQIAAGIINPVVLKKFTTFWLALEQINFLTKTMVEVENYLGKNFLIQENIHRIFHDETEKNLWHDKAKTEELEPFLVSHFQQLDIIKNPYGTGAVNLSARLNVSEFFSHFSAYFDRYDYLQEEKFDYEQIFGNVYKEFIFKNIVFCEGMGVRKNPFFNDIEVIPNKGHHLKVKLSQAMSQQYTLKKKHFLFPLDNQFHYYGGTYDPNERENEIDDFKKEELIAGLREFYPHEFKIEEINYGFRPTVKDRRPILGNHPQHKNFYIYNGLGARGILNGCFFAEKLFQHIEHGKTLMPEVNLERFLTR